MNTVRTHLEDVLALPTHFFVDIGASDCPGESQSEILLENGWSGVMFECDPVKYAGLTARMKGKPVQVIQDKVTVDNILSHLEAAGVPSDFYLSIDIDGYDYFVLSKILTVYKPQMIVSEINEKIPPPIQFTVLYDPDYWWKGNHYYGYSLSMLENLLPKFEYKILKLDLNNVILVPGTQTESLNDIYMNGYLRRPERNTLFAYNRDIETIYSLSRPNQVAFIRQLFKNHEGQYEMNGRVYVENTGQVQLTQPFGQWVAKYAGDTRFSRYLEVGTWTGRGSTCCFYEGFYQRTDTPVLQSYEIFTDRAKEAASLWKHVPSIQVTHGRVLEDHECPTYDVVQRIHPIINPEWHAEDVRNFWSCPYVAPNDPEVVLLDGAEYLTYFEFEKFRHMDSIRVFMLDDTGTAKNPHAHKVLSESPEWNLVASGTDRNGWSVFERIPVISSSEQTLEIPVDLEQ